MNWIDMKDMTEAMRTMKSICNEYHVAGCSGCPAKGKGKPCHSGDMSCCAPHRWWGIELSEEAPNE